MTSTAVRRSQPERVAAMRARLLDATIECLDDLGYAAMSTNDVVRRARVSRGALSHHFPTKADLVRAAAERLVEQRATEFRARVDAIAADRRTPAAALDVLWSFYDSASGRALLELTVAARHQPELDGVLGAMLERIDDATADVFGDYFPDLARLPHADAALRALHAMFAGIALGSMCDRDGGVEVRALLAQLLALPLDRAVPLVSTFARLRRPTSGGSR